jgi:carbonic anhydrase
MRRLLKLKKLFSLILFLLVFGLYGSTSPRFAQGAEKEAVARYSADQAFQKLMDGNLRFKSGHAINPNQGFDTLKKAAQGQSPFAIVLTCSDSRLSPEVIFDQGIGDLFVVRLAGNILTKEGLASIEYAIFVLGARYVMVLGHDHCGAVDATLAGGKLPGHLNELTAAIDPALQKNQCPAGDKLECAIEANVKYVVQKLSAAGPIVANKVASKEVRVDGAIFNIETGTVNLLEKNK